MECWDGVSGFHCPSADSWNAEAVSGVLCRVHRDNLEDSERQQLLALPGLRRGVDTCATSEYGASAVAAVSGDSDKQSARSQTIRALRELIEALERRAPQVGRVGEVAIAQAAAVLKNTALQRLAELERAEVKGEEYERA